MLSSDLLFYENLKHVLLLYLKLLRLRGKDGFLITIYRVSLVCIRYLCVPLLIADMYIYDVT